MRARIVDEESSDVLPAHVELDEARQWEESGVGRDDPGSDVSAAARRSLEAVHRHTHGQRVVVADHSRLRLPPLARRAAYDHTGMPERAHYHDGRIP